jgi:UDP-N-acetylglucosamine 2-epimerase
MKNAKKILTDSGRIQKEAYLLKTPCITTRNNTEWTETVPQKWNILVGMNKKKIIKAVNNIHPQTKGIKSVFGNGNTSQIIFQHIKSKLE